jgi:hypothetical protein
MVFTKWRINKEAQLFNKLLLFENLFVLLLQR